MATIQYDPILGQLRYAMVGVDTLETMAAFDREMIAFFRTRVQGRVVRSVLCDATRYGVQNDAISAAARTQMARSRDILRCSTAVVVGSMLNKLQAERIFSGLDVRVFRTEAAARLWLAETVAAARSTSAALA